MKYPTSGRQIRYVRQPLTCSSPSSLFHRGREPLHSLIRLSTLSTRTVTVANSHVSVVRIGRRTDLVLEFIDRSEIRMDQLARNPGSEAQTDRSSARRSVQARKPEILERLRDYRGKLARKRYKEGRGTGRG